MGVVRSEKIYQTDTGKITTVREMQSTHLMNAIRHHKAQMNLCNELAKEYSTADRALLVARAEDLANTIDVLANELADRNLADEIPKIKVTAETTR